MLGPFIPPTPDKPVDSSPHMDLDDDYMDKFDNQNCTADKDSTSVEGVVADGFHSDLQHKFPDGVPFSHLHENDDDQDDNDDNNLVFQMQSSNQISTSNLLGCNKY
jgi:hypothetical protein